MAGSGSTPAAVHSGAAARLFTERQQTLTAALKRPSGTLCEGPATPTGFARRRLD